MVQLSASIAGLTINDLRQILLGRNAGEWVNNYGDGLSSEQIASVVKVMSNDELSKVARAIFNALPGDGISIGSPGHFGSRISKQSLATIRTRYSFQFSRVCHMAAAM